ncbi:MAG: DNA-3-methyladenine glycosylase 2 family protein, partial [Planctomycetota bacterium]
QLVSFRDACAGWRQLVRRYGTPSPDLPKLWYPPEPGVLKRLVSSQFIECGILPQHGRRIVETMRRATRLEEAWNAGDGADAADRLCNRLELLPGIGPWTIGFLRGSSLGDVDAELVGDYSHPKHVAHFFGKPIAGADDEQMLKLLEPYRPHRFYALCLIILGSPAPPRRGPRRRSIRDRLR